MTPEFCGVVTMSSIETSKEVPGPYRCSRATELEISGPTLMK